MYTLYCLHHSAFTFIIQDKIRECYRIYSKCRYLGPPGGRVHMGHPNLPQASDYSSNQLCLCSEVWEQSICWPRNV